MYDELDYYGALRLAQQTPWNVNHGGWIIHEDDIVKYTLDTLNNGKSFRIGRWEPGKHIGQVVREIRAPAEIQFLLSLSVSNDE